MKKRLFLILFLFLIFTNAFAGSATSGTLSTVHTFASGQVLVYTNGSRSDVPTCATIQPARFAINGNTAGGKVLAAAVLTAYSLGKRVTIIGNGTCDVYGDTESISYIYTND